LLLAASLLGTFPGCGKKTVLLGTQTSSGGAGGDEAISKPGGGAGSTSSSSSTSVVSAVPVRVGNIAITAGGLFSRLLLGDVNGDGRFDLVTMQPDVITDNKLPHAVVALTAFDLDGHQLWQVGSPDPNAEGSASDIPAQIYDIDGDGENEVLAVMNDELRVLNGVTGAVETTHALPDPNAHDAIIFANFSGRTQPSDIVLKNRYAQLWAYNRDFDLLFTFSGETGYYPWPFDWDGDGRDELLAGCHFLAHDGTERWNCVSDTDTVVDAVWAADLDPTTHQGPEVIVSGGDTNVYRPDGTKVFSLDTVEAQNLVIGDFRPDLPGLEIAGLDRVNRTANGKDALFIASSDGQLLWKEKRAAGSGWTTIVTMVHDWDGSGEPRILAYGRSDVLPTLYDGKFNVVATFPEDGALFMVADLCGDAREEIVAYTDAYAHIYATGRCPLDSHVTGQPRPQPKALYNWTRYWGGETP
jgi:hypothetical protein